MDETNPTGATAPPPPPPPPPPAAGPAAPPTAGSPPPAQPVGSNGQRRFFDGIRGTGISRSEHRIIGGVCGGLARRTGIDVTVVRVITVVLFFFGGLGVLAYALAWLLLPEPDGRIHAEQLLHGDVSAGAVGAILLTLGSIGSPGAVFGHWPGGWGWQGHGAAGFLWGSVGTVTFFAGLAFVIYLITRSRRGSPSSGGAGYSAGPTLSAAEPAAPGSPAAPGFLSTPYGVGPSFGGTATMTAPAPMAPPNGALAAPPAPSTPRRPSLGGFGTLIGGGLALLGAGIVVLVTRNGDYSVSTAAMAWAVALAVIALTVIVGGLLGRRSGLMTLVAIFALLGTLAAAAIPRAAHVQTVGDRTWRPTATAQGTGGYSLGVGHATLDLTSLDLVAASGGQPETIPVSVGIGQLTVRVPATTTVKIVMSAGAGALPLPASPTITSSDEDLGDGGAFAGRGDQGDLGGVSIKRTLTVGDGPVQLVVRAKVTLGEIDVEQVAP